MCGLHPRAAPQLYPFRPARHQANELYEYFTRALGEQGVSHIETGVFGADMAVTLLNERPGDHYT